MQAAQATPPASAPSTPKPGSHGPVPPQASADGRRGGQRELVSTPIPTIPDVFDFIFPHLPAGNTVRAGSELISLQPGR